jgi:hypothetical protein
VVPIVASATPARTARPITGQRCQTAESIDALPSYLRILSDSMPWWRVGWPLSKAAA